MKKLFSAVLLAGGLLLNACDVILENAPVSMTIYVQGAGAPGAARPNAFIDVEMLMITQAQITVVDTQMSETVYNWYPQVTAPFEYSSIGQGDYQIQVREWDVAGHSNYTARTISLEPGWNYQVTITLGGSIWVEVVSNTSPTNSSTNSVATNLTMAPVDLTLIWHNIPECVSNQYFVWYPFNSISFYNGMFVSNSTPVITGNAEWMHTEDMNWNPAYGRTLSLNAQTHSAVFQITVPAGVERDVMLKMASRLGWDYGHEIQIWNHSFTLPVSGSLLLNMEFDNSNNYDPGTNVAYTLADQLFTIVWQNIPVTQTNWNNYIWYPQSGATYTTNYSLLSNSTAVITGSGTWMHRDAASTWTPQQGRYVSMSNNTAQVSLLVPAGSPRYIEFLMVSELGWDHGMETFSGPVNHAYTLPTAGGATISVNWCIQ